MSFLSGIVVSVTSAVAAALKIVSAAVDYFKTKETIDVGKKIHSAESVVENQKSEREQTEILLEDRPKANVVKKMEDGTF